MAEFTIFTDSGSDLTPEFMQELGVKYCSLNFHFEGEDKEYSNYDLQGKAFYDELRQGKITRTAAVNIYNFTEAFEEELKKGRDVLYMGLDSAISSTCASGIKAAETLQEEYPDRKVIAVDPLCASCGLGLLVKLTVDKQRAGASIEECAEFARTTGAAMAHWFTVDDLIYLKRGGRIGAGAYFAASMLDIKPILHVDNEGNLVNVSKVRGRKKSIKSLIARYEADALDTAGPVAIFHGDCQADADALIKTFRDKFGADVMTGKVGAVIGSHTGPEILVITFPAKNR